MNAPHAEPAAHEQPADETSIRYEGWPVVGVCFLIATFAWAGGFYGQGVYLAEFQRLYGWPASLISTATTCYYLVSAVMVVFVAEGIRALGPRRLLILGILLMAAGTALVGQVTAVWQLYAVYALIAAGWAGTSLAAINNTLGLWFDRKRGMAISLALNGASCGGVFGVPLLVGAIGIFGLPATSIGAALVMLALAIPAILIWVGQPPKRVTPPAASGAAPVVRSIAQIRSAAFGNLSFWTVTVPFSLLLVAQVGFIVHLISFLDPVMGRDRASIAVSLMTAMAVIGRLLFGAVVDRIDQRKASSVSAISQAIALVVLINTRQDVALFAACALFGFSVGNMITLPSLIVQQEFSPAAFGVVVSLVTAICQFTYAFGPGLIGLLRDAFGGYAVPFYACAVLQVIAAAIVLIRPKMLKTV
ncbi:MAG: MFS transporter [Afipia sp.]|nr:MFS transporter [Afipia sp.]